MPATGSTIHDAATGRDFAVGGHSAGLDEQEQFKQLLWYLNEHYPTPEMSATQGSDEYKNQLQQFDHWLSRLPDRLTHAALMMLGTAVDQATPATAYTVGADVEVTDIATDTLCAWHLAPAEPSKVWVISCHPGGLTHGAGKALDFWWRPETAAVAVLGNVHLLDVDYPLSPVATVTQMVDMVSAAVEYARAHNAKTIVGYGAGCGTLLIQALAEQWDRMVLLDPINNWPAEVECSIKLVECTRWPETLLQCASHNEQGEPVDVSFPVVSQVRASSYTGTDAIAVPAVLRGRTVEAASFIVGKPIVDPRIAYEENIRRAALEDQG